MGGGPNEHIEEPVWEAVDWEVRGIVNSGVHVNDIWFFVWLVAPQDGRSPVVQLFDPLGLDAITFADGYGGGDVPLDGLVPLGGLLALFPSQGLESLLQKVSFLLP